MLTFHQLMALIQSGGAERVADALLALDELERRALAAPLKRIDYLDEPPYEPEPHGPDETESEARARASREWFRDHLARRARMDALRTAGAACLPRAADISSWLRSTRFHIAPLEQNVAQLVRVLQAPGRPSIPAVARTLAARMRADTADLYWPIVSAMLDAAALPMPVHEGTVSAWLAAMDADRGTRPLLESLRTSPWTPALLPHVFTIRGVGRLAGPDWPAAVAALCADGGCDRRMLLDGALHRLREGDRQNALVPFVALHELLAPTVEEQVRAVPDYLGMLSVAYSPVAGLAARALHEADRNGLLDARSIADAGSSLLSRREKKLVRAGLELLGAALDRGPEPELFAALVSGLGARSTDLAEAALALVARHLPAAGADGRTLLTAATASLDGDLRRQADTILGSPPAGRAVTPSSSGDADRLPPFVPPGPMPAPYALPAELADAVAMMHRGWGQEPLQTERILDAVARFAYADRAALAEALAPIVETVYASRITAVLWAAVHGRWVRSPSRPDHYPLPYRMLDERADELGRQLCGTPPPALLATPATVAGHVDPDRVLALLTAAERDGWQPGPLDLSQALLRLPRDLSAVASAAGRLSSPAGQTFARWTRDGGLPDPVVTMVDVPARECDHQPACTRCPYPKRQGERARRVVSFPPIAHELPGLAADLFALPESAASERVYWNREQASVDWVTTLPSHRELVAAFMQLPLAAAADGAVSHQLDVLPILAGADGPCGPAVALCLAYGLAAGRPGGRVATVDAFLMLAARGDLDGTLVGRELAALAGIPGAIGLTRVADGLGEALRAGAGVEVWEVLRELVPALLALPTVPAATAEMLALAEAAAAVTGARDDLPSVAAAATRKGRIATEAARLDRTLARHRTGERT